MPGSEGPASRADEKDNVAIHAAQNILQNPSSMSESRETANQLLDSTLGALVLSWTLENMPPGDERRQELAELGAKHPVPNVRDLFERFLPMQDRTERLGEVIDFQKILTLKGNIARGRELFLAAEVQCRSCHRVHGMGNKLGPELDEIGKKYNRAQLLETIVEPSKKIDPKYMAFLATTTEGKVYTGLLVEQNPDGIILKTVRNETIRLATSEIEDLEPQEKSFMPDQMLRDLTARDAADLLAYLSSLK
jgi:putative heme-binding domain-containing protein